jgi:hypothetical protein
MDYYSAIRKNEILMVIIWMELRIIILSEVRQTQKKKYHMISIIFRI